MQRVTLMCIFTLIELRRDVMKFLFKLLRFIARILSMKSSSIYYAIK